MEKKFDFSGWATRNNLKCSDGRTIMKDAFKINDGQKVPLVWNHQHNEAYNVLGHALLENRPEGVYAFGVFNETEQGKNAKLLVEHGDVLALSIYANQLKQQGANVFHGAIREVSLVLAGANPGAFIDSVIMHNAGQGEDTEEEAIIYTGEKLDIYHAEKVEEVDEKQEDIRMELPKLVVHAEDPEETEEKDKTIQEVFDTLNEEQKTVVYALVGEAMNDQEDDEKEEPGMKHNVFDQEFDNQENTLSHAEMTSVISDAKRFGSLKESALSHGITDIEFLFPDAKMVGNTPTWITRRMDWVTQVMNGTHHTPFSRIKSMAANITEDEARARGYIKGNLKVEEQFSLLKRTTGPQTIYKKQKLDRDDVIDITDFDVVAWLKAEMRVMLDEEIARAVLVGDGRSTASDDKIQETNIRPIWTDADLYTIKTVVTVAADATSDAKAKQVIHAAVRSRKLYKGAGNPTFFTTEDVLTDMLLMEDTTGRIIYDSTEKLATAMRVKNIITVPVMEGLTRESGGDTLTLLGIIVNLSDYNIGADKGGAINLFDDFDIDYNAQKYLIETRCSGALVVPYSAIAIESKPAS